MLLLKTWSFRQKKWTFKDVTFFPVSALKGINIVTRSEEYTPWYEGGSVLDFLEEVPVAPGSQEGSRRRREDTVGGP